LGVCLIFTLFVYRPFHWSTVVKPGNRSLVFLTNNVANNNHQSFRPFVQDENPDVIALQDAALRSRNYAKEFPDRFVTGCDQFILISKYPILSAQPVPGADWLGHPVAARFEISVNGELITVFNVHMPTPRPDFAKLRRTGLLREMLSSTWNRKRPDNRSYRESMQARIELAQNLVRRIAEEKQPFVVMGDFNMPDHGYIHHLFASRFRDAFPLKGRGWGATFPGFGKRNFLMPGPWLRIDYIFAGTGWKIEYCRTEPDRRSKHRGVAAGLERP
ncbi:MAG: endonuclease/exonuclease/phosphatase family protein, partial [Verrucomicrobiota bacterium]